MFDGIFPALIVLTAGAFVLQGLRKIPAKPPHKALVTIFGARVEKTKNEGWRFFPLYPYWYGYIPVKVEKVDHNLPPQIIRTPDLAELTVPISMTWTPIATGEGLKTFINNGGESGVKNILEDIVAERLRNWAIAKEEGPVEWQEAMAAGEKASATLLKAILGDRLIPIPSEIPTLVLFSYFGSPKKKPRSEEDKLKWGENWEKVDEILEREGKEKVREAFERRRQEVIRARQGNGTFELPQLGIVINRLNIGEIKPNGNLAKSAELKVKEEQERKAEVYEVETDLIKARSLVEAAKKSGQSLTLKEAFQIIMEWKTTREGRGFTVPGVAPAIAEVAKIFTGRK
ncbi:MAG: SPFH domain-containing protein [Patescibacteria group bacterium]|nr:SPFH domain-containing protein [Patescibacteria group bacterium]